jgi:hypothetical protein
MSPRVGKSVLSLSAAGHPLRQLAIRRLGRRGAVVTELACARLALRDAAMIAAGIPARLRRGPAILLWLELAAAVAAAGLGLQLGVDEDPSARPASQPGPAEMARRIAVGVLFGFHTVRFWISLRPHQGGTSPTADW